MHYGKKKLRPKEVKKVVEKLRQVISTDKGMRLMSRIWEQKELNERIFHEHE